MQTSTLAIIASLGRLAFTAAVVAGAGAVIGLGFVDPAAAQIVIEGNQFSTDFAPVYVMSQEIEDHGYLDWLILTALWLPVAGLAWHVIDATRDVIAWRESRRREARERETIIVAELWRRAYERAHGYQPVSDGDLSHWAWRATVMVLMTIASRDRPRLAVLFPSLFAEESR